MANEKTKSTIKINKDQAKKEVDKWLEAKRVKQSMIEESIDSIEQLADEVADGFLILNEEDNTWTQKLVWPLGNNETVTELVYKPRITDLDINKYSKGIKTNDFRGQINAVTCALTDQPMGIINKLDTEDRRTARSLSGFFM